MFFQVIPFSKIIGFVYEHFTKSYISPIFDLTKFDNFDLDKIGIK